MTDRNRREFLADVGRGMLLASLGPAVAADLGLADAAAADGEGKLTFGKLEPRELADYPVSAPQRRLARLLVEPGRQQHLF